MQQVWMRGLTVVRSATLPGHARAVFHTLSSYQEKALPPRRKIDENEIEEAFLKGSGPGGQKINKTSSAVQLKHIPTGLVVKCQETRSREQNRKYARQILADKLDQMTLGPLSRTALKIERASKKKESANKKSRRKYRLLDEAKKAKEEAEQKTTTEQGESTTDQDKT